MSGGRRKLLVVVALLALALGACGGDRTFDDEELITELNAAGAELALGETLTETDEGVPVRTVSFLTPSGEPPVPGEAGHGAGNMVLLDGEEEARAEFERCEATATLVCYRIANAVLRFLTITETEKARLNSAVAALQSS